MNSKVVEKKWIPRKVDLIPFNFSWLKQKEEGEGEGGDEGVGGKVKSSKFDGDKSCLFELMLAGFFFLFFYFFSLFSPHSTSNSFSLLRIDSCTLSFFWR